jgi:uncharacterized protein (DUF885 family)
MLFNPTAAPTTLAGLLLAGSVGGAAWAQDGNDRPSGWHTDPPAIGSLVAFARQESDLRTAIERYDEDRGALMRRYDVPGSPVRRERLAAFYQSWQSALDATNFSDLNHEAQIDYILLRHRLAFELAMLEQEQREQAEMAPLLPFACRIQELQEARRERKDVDSQPAAQTLAEVSREVDKLTQDLRAEARRGGGIVKPQGITPVIAHRAAGEIESLRGTLRDWYGFFGGYDPVFTWWAKDPYDKLDKALQAYAGAIREHIVGVRQGQPEPIIGDPIGAEGLRAHLAHEMMPYTPEELVAIAQREFAWCEVELLRASRDMGHGDDWKAAQEAVKKLAVEPGRKPAIVRELAEYSEQFIRERDLISIPPLAGEVWRMEMMSPERQLVSPFFLGGEVIRISYPTDTMSHEDKLMSMRGNNPHFNFATVHHELIPGHHLQGFMTDRFNGHRSLFSTPFWGEGWALYWEMLLWDQGFPRGPEDRIGMLFWRMHRAARIIFSLSFHLETMTPQECIDFLVDRVGHERANAEAEVRRSFNGSYSPLYQVGYMIGGLQFRALREELVQSGQMTDRQFHDAVLQGGRMPVEMVRARLIEQELSPEYETQWRFAGEPLERDEAQGP